MLPKFLHLPLQRIPLLQGGRNFCRKAQKWRKKMKWQEKLVAEVWENITKSGKKIVEQNCCIFKFLF
jgi:hypothetical protein